MKLADLRRLAIRKSLRIQFSFAGNRECLIDEHGIARVPHLNSIPDFNLEASLPDVLRFRIESSDPASKAGVRLASPAEVEKLIAGLSPAAVASADHDE